jgi:hypothetical protein
MIVFGREHDANLDTNRGETRHWIGAFVTSFLLFNLALFLFLNEHTRLTPFQQTFIQTLETADRIRDASTWTAETEEMIQRYIEIHEIVDSNETGPEYWNLVNKALLTLEHQATRSEKPEIQELFKMARGIVEIFSLDGVMSADEKAFVDTLFFKDSVKPDITEHLKIVVNKHNELATLKNDLSHNMVVMKDMLILDAPFRIAVEGLGDYISIPLAMVFLTMLLGFDNLVFSALLMQIYADWRGSLFEWALNGDTLIKTASGTSSLWFVVSLFFGGGFEHIPLYLVFVTFKQFSLSSPYVSMFAEFANKQRCKHISNAGEFSWSYAVWNGTYLLVSNHHPLKFLVYLPAISNIISGCLIYVFLWCYDAVGDNVRVFGATLMEMEQSARIRISYMILNWTTVLMFCILVFALWKLAQETENAKLIHDGVKVLRKGDFTKLPGWRQTLTKVLPLLFKWRNTIKVVSFVVVTLSQHFLPGQTSWVFYIIEPFTAIEKAIPESLRQQIELFGFPTQ